MKPIKHPFNTERHRQIILAIVKNLKLDGEKPYEINISEVIRKRKDSQSRLFHVWCSEISKQSGDTKDEVKVLCKLDYGIPILCRDTEGFGTTWERIKSKLSYLDLLFAVEQWDVTSILNVSQMAELLTKMQMGWAIKGYPVQSINETLYYEALGNAA